jgi:hypothetical protein
MRFLTPVRVLSILALLAAIPVLGYAALLWHHNDTQAPFTQHEAKSLFNGAERWILSHREQVLAQDNPILWWMLKRAVTLQPSAELDALWNEFRGRSGWGWLNRGGVYKPPIPAFPLAGGRGTSLSGNYIRFCCISRTSQPQTHAVDLDGPCARPFQKVIHANRRLQHQTKWRSA